MDKKIFRVKGTFVNGQWFNSKKRYDVFNPSMEKQADAYIRYKRTFGSPTKAQLSWSKISLINKLMH